MNIIKKCETKEGAAIAWNNMESGWISVIDRLPDENEYVLRLWPKGLWPKSGGIACDVGRIYYEVLLCNGVTHWMPLPEPPEVEE